MKDISSYSDTRQELESLENILFFRGSIDYLLTEYGSELENIHSLKSSIRSLVNDCIESSLQYTKTDREQIDELRHLLR